MLLSERMFGCLRGFEGVDDGVEVAEHGAVHLDQALVAASLGSGDQFEGLLPLRVVLGQELAGREEHRAGQTGFSELMQGHLVIRHRGRAFVGSRGVPRSTATRSLVSIWASLSLTPARLTWSPSTSPSQP